MEKTLKKDQSWDEAFTDYKFTPCQSELMKLFNIRYECNDARNDYSKLLKQKNETGGVFPHWFNSDDNVHLTMMMTMVLILWYMKSMKKINTLPLAKRVSKY